MNTQLKNALTSPIFLKMMSLILGSLFWVIISDSFISSRWVTLPVCFYNSATKKITAPETIRIELKGKRTYLKQLPEKDLALHIDAQDLPTGSHKIEITKDLLLLPSSIILGESLPHSIMVTVTQGDVS
jgi:hypothetical protein